MHYNKVITYWLIFCENQIPAILKFEAAWVLVTIQLQTLSLEPN